MDEDIVVDMDEGLRTDSFATDVARYFKALLESNYQGGLLPARRVQAERLQGLRTWQHLDSHPQLQKNLYKNLTSGFAQDVFVLSQNKYVSPPDDQLNKALERAVEAVSTDDAARLGQSLVRAADVWVGQTTNSLTSQTDRMMQAALELLLAEFVVPLFRAAQGTGKQAVDIPYAVKTAAAGKLFGVLSPALGQLYDSYIQGATTYESLRTGMQAAVSADVLRLGMREFVDEIVTTDAYQQLYQLHRNNQVLDTTRMFLYFCELSVGEHSFPLFYTEVMTSHAYPSISCTFDMRVQVNMQALDFVIKEFGHMVGLDEVVTGEIDSIFTITAKNRKDLLPWMQQVIDVVADTFDFDQDINLEHGSAQIATNAGVTLNNRLQFALFDSPNEAVVMDYQAILSGEKAVAEPFQALLSGYIMNDPVRFVQDIAEEWQGTPIADRLLSTNPLPLNDEQKQAMLAISKPDCKITTIQGAAGSGKTHLASALVADALVNNRPTLLVSDTKAARDQVAGEVLSAIREVREGAYFHAPILRLDDFQESQLGEIESFFLEKLRAHQSAYAAKQSELKAAKTRKIKDSTESINVLIQEAENVNLHEVEQMVNSEAKFGGREWIQGEPIEELGPDLQQLHQAVQYIRQSDANYLLPYIDASQQDAIAEFIEIIRAYERANKGVHERLPEFIVRYRKLLPDQKDDLQTALSYVHSNYRHFVKMLANDQTTAGLEISDNTNFKTLSVKKALLMRLVDLAKTARKYVPNDQARGDKIINELLAYEVPPEEAAVALNNYIEQVESLKSKIFGFSGRTLVVENLTRQLRKAIPQFTIAEPEKQLDELAQMSGLMEYIIEQLAKMGLDLVHWKQVLHILRSSPAHIKELVGMVDTLEAPAGYEFMASHKVYEADNLLANIGLLEQASELNRVYKANQNLSKLFGIKSIGQVLAQPEAFTSRFNKLATDLEDVKQLEESKRTIKKFMKTWPDVVKRLGVSYANGALTVLDESFAGSASDDLKEYLAFKRREQDVTAYFREMIADNYAQSMRELQQMTSMQMSYQLDAKLLKYVEANASAFTALKNTLRNKQRLTMSQLKTLQSLYPCIIADAKSYAAYLPLQFQSFELLVIDEASRISVAEILPAMFRAKKIVVLGDTHQQQNAKAEFVHAPLNDLFRKRMESAFLRSLGEVPADTKNKYLQRLRGNFDVSRSVLDFVRGIANMELTFHDYYQSAPDIIGFVNKHFYGESLRCLKARALPIQDMIRIDRVDAGDGADQGLHTNAAEIARLMVLLDDLKETGYEGTIGIVTPYYEQAALIQKELDESVINDWFERRELKVMTFDTAQGEVRDYVFYSMVATAKFDDLQYILPTDLERIDTPQARRLNVALSRSAETIHVLASKPVRQFAGTLGAALMQFESQVTAGGAKSPVANTDILLAADSLLPHYFYSTKFYKKHSDKVRLITHFAFGDYIKALVPKYRHPSYKVDFMVTLGDERIIITFDELKEKFLSNESKEVVNYLSPEELYAQKILEGYGYRILKLNRFNLGPRPIETLDRLLSESIKTVSWPRDNGFLTRS